MQAVTLFISLVGSVLVLFLRPAKAFAAYIAVLLFYPMFLSVQVGTLDFKASRIVAAVLLLRCLLSPKLKKKFTVNMLDKWVFFGLVVPLIIKPLDGRIPIMQVLEPWSGGVMDTLFTYLVARFCITNRAALIESVKWIAMVFVPLAVLGITECLTGWQPYIVLQRFCPWDPIGAKISGRYGLYRATGAFGHPIRFGAAFALFLPLVYWLRHQRGYWRQHSYLLAVLLAAGAMSCMSSGPWMMIITLIGCLALEHAKHLVKPLLIFFGISCLLVDVISNRRFFDVLVRYINPIGGSAWHRSRLIHLAIDNFGEWWLTGYGGQDPGWGPRLGMEWTDITNQYILAGVSNGMLGVIALCGILATAIYLLARRHKAVKDPVLRSLYWALGCAMVMVAISFNGCLFSAQAGILYYCILGIIGSAVCFSDNTTMPIVSTRGFLANSR